MSGSLNKVQLIGRLGEDPEIVAEELRAATKSLGRVFGAVDVENLLDIVFGDFCIGK